VRRTYPCDILIAAITLCALTRAILCLPRPPYSCDSFVARQTLCLPLHFVAALTVATVCLFVCLFVFAVLTLTMGQVMVGSQIYSRKVISISLPILGTSIHVPRALCSVWSQIRNISMILLLVVYGTTSASGVWHRNGACSQKCAEISELRYFSKHVWISLLGFFFSMTLFGSLCH